MPHIVPIPRPNLPHRQIATREMADAAHRHRMIRARYDSQFTTEDNRRHWATADTTSVDAGANPMVRRILRMRSRHEFHNNSYAMGMLDTLANYVIGTGPRLQMLIPKNKKLNKQIEDLWDDWAQEVGLGETFRIMRLARFYNGESFSLLRTNPRLSHPVKLDIFQVEADQVTSPMLGIYPAQYPDQFFDGVVLDPYGRPQAYDVLRQHPGAFGAFMLLGTEFDRWPAQYVIHDYKKIRPGQQRGVPEIVPALPLFAQLRRYRLAVLSAAETAADFAVLLHTKGPANGDDQDGDALLPFTTADLQSNMMTVLPDGYDASQMRAEQPTTTFDMFCLGLLSEICRCINMPLVFASMDARQANMSSSYVVTQPFIKSVEVDRAGYNRHLNHLFDEFMTEAIHCGIDGLSPDSIPVHLPHTWRWPRIGHHADPLKTANAQDLKLKQGTTSIPHECAEDGRDWEEVQESQAKALGMSLEQYRAALRESIFAVSGTAGPAADAPPTALKPDSDDDRSPVVVDDEDDS